MYFKGISIFKMRFFPLRGKKKKVILQTNEFCDTWVTERGFNVSFQVSLGAVHHLLTRQFSYLFITSGRMRQETGAGCWGSAFLMKLLVLEVQQEARLPTVRVLGSERQSLVLNSVVRQEMQLSEWTCYCRLVKYRNIVYWGKAHNRDFCLCVFTD